MNWSFCSVLLWCYLRLYEKLVLKVVMNHFVLTEIVITEWINPLLVVQLEMDKSWMSTDRTKKRYEEGVAEFLRYAVNHLREEGDTHDEYLMLCTCTDCLNHRACLVGDVEGHLFVNGINQTYTTWNKHGEKDETTNSRPVNVDNGMHAEFEMGSPTDAPDENFGMGTPTDDPNTIDMMQAAKVFAYGPIKFKKLLEDAEKPLYEGCPNFTKLSAIVQLFKLKSKHGASDMFFNELLPLIKDMLPKEGNLLARSTYHAKKVLKAMVSWYTKIHACTNNCILHRNEYKDEKVCPTCKAPRWKVDMDGKVYENVPAKVLWYFDIIPRFQRLFQSKPTTENLIWHDTTRKKDGVLRHPADSHIWREIDNNFPEIKGDPRNLRLAVSADGVDVNKGTKNHSVWPVLVVIYNLPPWMCMKRKFIMLSLLIDGAPGKNIDVLLEALVKDFQFLFENRKRTWDAYAQEMFTLREVVLWTINDYPTLGTLCGCRYAGYHGCVVCRKKTHSIRLHDSKKNVYVGYIRFLPYEHPFRRHKKAFGGKQEWETAPKPMTGKEIYEEVKYIKNSWGRKGKNTQVEDVQATPGKGGKMNRIRKISKEVDRSVEEEEGRETTYWRRYNIWHRLLRYWRYNDVQHCIDFMHVENNVGQSLVGTLLHNGNSKDGLNARLDLVRLGLKPELQPKSDVKGTILPAACYTLNADEKDIFLETLSELRVPEGYCSNFSTLVNRKERKLIGLKSHDYHMLMQQFLLVAIRSIMPTPVRYAIMRFCFFFRSISAKEINVEDLDKLQEDLCVTLCLLEKCMKVTKGHVRNKNQPCGCIAEENAAEETIEMYCEYHRSIKTIGIPLDRHNTSHNGQDSESVMEGELLSAGEKCIVTRDQLRQAHFYVMENTPEIEPYIDEFQVEKDLEVDGENISENLRWISHGPHYELAKHTVYRINGYLFRTRSRDRIHQNSGISVAANDMHISRDDGVTYGKASYYGVLQEIWELDYCERKIHLFKCNWVDTKCGVKSDILGYNIFELTMLGHKNDPFILASQARQVFYVKDQKDKKKSIVFVVPPKNYRDAYNDGNDEEFRTVIFSRNDNILSAVDPQDLGKESRNDYFRTDCRGLLIRNP
ncbi:uncharacterized protein LOC113340137 [Papaver somniferum]|uniref:uncharacterized protein LOC113340137 n=1 Tax=Papaver somniferum TaxID=3469 RepID=UPI000E6FB360|nr:uncharacterized protein LOC113340137 [Papaver somniferum]